jgi:enoyl-CoA hydratase
MGLVGFYVEETKDLLPKALEIADKLAAGPPLAIAASKAGVNAYMRAVSASVMSISLQAEGLTLNSRDHQEAVAAFQEKRPAKFEGK